ncbi:MAG: galactitol-1-phosphate 5-dehydrogenase [Peptococcaceae bacterium]|jgi:L-iditol 2-dehydrogenase|nr:galactitol-1-phosphate 5-dehydrogenase [Peptococcaceae bacterium]
MTNSIPAEMKAVMLQRPGTIKVGIVPVPEPGEKELLLLVSACGVCGSDFYRMMIDGAHKMPIIPGHEFSGVVVKTGKSATSFNVGDNVVVAPLIPCGVCEWCLKGEYSLCNDYDYYGSRRNGAFAEYVAVHADNAIKLPSGVNMDLFALVDSSANAVHALMQSRIKIGDSLIVLGCGSVGLFAVQWAKYFGAGHITAIDINDDKLALAKILGADLVVNTYKDDVASMIRNIGGYCGANTVLEMAGTKEAQKLAISLGAKLGRIVFFGISHQTLELSREDVENILRKELSITGSWNSFSPPFPGVEWVESIKRIHSYSIKADEIISVRCTLDELPGIMYDSWNKKVSYNKILCLPNR